jgi:hypothetical protein
VLVGNPSFVPGKFGVALYLNGNCNGLNVPRRAFLGQITGDLTAALWIYPDSFGDYSTVFDTVGRELSLWIDTDTKGSYSMGGKGGGTKFSQPFTLGEWQHVAFVKQGGKAMLYRNGVLSATVKASSINTQDWIIGINRSGGGTAWNGKVDDVQLYNSALTPAEIMAAWCPTTTEP